MLLYFKEYLKYIFSNAKYNFCVSDLATPSDEHANVSMLPLAVNSLE